MKNVCSVLDLDVTDFSCFLSCDFLFIFNYIKKIFLRIKIYFNNMKTYLLLYSIKKYFQG